MSRRPPDSTTRGPSRAWNGRPSTLGAYGSLSGEWTRGEGSGSPKKAASSAWRSARRVEGDAGDGPA